MENPDEIDLFMAELMKRPLVLQPSAFIGRGLSIIRCTLYSNEGKYKLDFFTQNVIVLLLVCNNDL